MFRLITGFVLVQVGSGLGRADEPQPTPPLQDLVRQSSYVFVGTALKLKTTTGGSIPAGNRTAIVLVNEVIYERTGLPDLTNKRITIELNGPKSVKVGQQGTFFTTGGQVGVTITVREVAHLDTVNDTATLRKLVAGIIQQQIDENVGRRVATAELIVVGKLARIEPADFPGLGVREGPEWYEGEIEVQSVEKGQLSGKKISFLLAHHVEINSEKRLRSASEREPRLHRGQEGIWILHRNEVPRLGTSGRYTAEEPIDIQPEERLPMIRQSINATQPPTRN